VSHPLARSPYPSDPRVPALPCRFGPSSPPSGSSPCLSPTTGTSGASASSIRPSRRVPEPAEMQPIAVPIAVCPET
jgi:hypothetical protein